MEMARLWMIRVRDPDFDDWDGFTAWLEADRVHRAAYETALDEDEWAENLFAHRPAHPVVADHAAAPDADTPAAPPRRQPWLAWGGAIAAAIALVGGWAIVNRGASDIIVTAPGEHRTIALADGSRIVMNGGTRIAYDADQPRFARLEKGEALFEIRHDEARPFVVMAGETRLVDAGTVFNVVNDKHVLEVEVAEGAVIYEGERNPIRLNPGDALVRLGPATARARVSKANIAAVGSWREGVLQYNDATLADIAADLGRNLGVPVRAARGADRLRFTGTLAINGPAREVLARTGPLLGVTFAENGNAWEMTPADGARR